MARFWGVAALMALGMASPAVAQSSITGGMQVIETYYAYLSEYDHYNSNGARLTEPWQIIRQDRANFHRFGIRDDGDDWDSFFASATNRARMESMLAHGHISPHAAWTVVNSDAFIRVDLLGSGNVVRAVQVDVQ